MTSRTVGRPDHRKLDSGAQLCKRPCSCMSALVSQQPDKWSLLNKQCMHVVTVLLYLIDDETMTTLACSTLDA